MNHFLKNRVPRYQKTSTSNQFCEMLDVQSSVQSKMHNCTIFYLCKAIFAARLQHVYPIFICSGIANMLGALRFACGMNDWPSYLFEKVRSLIHSTEKMASTGQRPLLKSWYFYHYNCWNGGWLAPVSHGRKNHNHGSNNRNDGNKNRIQTERNSLTREPAEIRTIKIRTFQNPRQ